MTTVKRMLGIAVLAACVALAIAQQPPASQIGIGGKVPNLKLQTLSGATAQLHSLNGQNGALLLFVATKCPVSNDYNERMAALARDYTSRGFAVIGINSNKTEPADEVSKHAAEKGLAFTILKDPDNVVADYFGASFTPEAYLFDRDWTLRYHGRIDDSRNTANITSQDLRTAMDALQTGKAVPVTETKAFGCTIKRVAKGS
ncbi:MAG: redoxin domain-containing protein [Acidobacteria bacterium]|nr:redoxin domain-containing protein [Acidobacteriota bacterium]